MTSRGVDPADAGVLPDRHPHIGLVNPARPLRSKVLNGIKDSRVRRDAGDR